MKKLFLSMTLILLAGVSTAVVGADCPPGQPCITSGGDSGAPQGQGTIEIKGSDWSASLTPKSSQPSTNISEGIFNESFNPVNGSSRITFDGVMQVPSSCYYPDMEVNKTGENSYETEILQKQIEGNVSCTQAIEKVSYSIKFSADQPFSLKATQGEISENFTHPNHEKDEGDGNSSSKREGTEDEETSSSKGLFSGLLSWLGGLF